MPETLTRKTDEITDDSERRLVHEIPDGQNSTETSLLSGKVVNQEFAGGGAFDVELDNGEKGRYWVPTSAKSRNERAAYLIDRAWHFGLVPVTVLREFKDPDFGFSTGQVSFQKYIENATDARNIPDFENIDEFQDDLYRLWLLQYSIWHTDSHKGNVLATDKIHAIDHAHAFWDDKDRTKQWNDEEEKMEQRRGTFKEFYGVQAPEDVIKDAKDFMEDEQRQQVLLEQLKELHYYEDDLEACLARMRHIAEVLVTKGRIDAPSELAEYSPE